MGGKNRKGWAKEAAAFKAQLGDGFGGPGSGPGMGGIDDAFARESRRHEVTAARHEAELRAKACSSKKRYPTQHDAELTARDCEHHGSPKLHAYRCPYCNGWHLTHKPPR